MLFRSKSRVMNLSKACLLCKSAAFCLSSPGGDSSRGSDLAGDPSGADRYSSSSSKSLSESPSLLNDWYRSGSLGDSSKIRSSSGFESESSEFKSGDRNVRPRKDSVVQVQRLINRNIDQIGS